MSFRKRLILSQQKRAAAAAATAATSFDTANIVFGGSAPRWTPRDVVDIATPRDVEIDNILKSAVHEIGDQARPTNSQKAMDPKKEEWMQYCDSLFPSDP